MTLYRGGGGVVLIISPSGTGIYKNDTKGHKWTQNVILQASNLHHWALETLVEVPNI